MSISLVHSNPDAADDAGGLGTPEGPETSDDSRGDGPGDEEATNGAGDQGLEIPWSDGDRVDLPVHLDPAFQNLKKGWDAGKRELADLRKGLEAERSEIAQERQRLTELTAALQARIDGSAPAETPQEASEWTEDRFRQAFNGAKSREEQVATLFQVVQGIAGSNRGGSELTDKLDVITRRLDDLDRGLRPTREANQFRSVYAEMQRDSHPEFADPKFKGALRGVLDSDDPAINNMLARGDAQGIKNALAHAALKAKYKMDVEAITQRAQRRPGAKIPSGPDSSKTTKVKDRPAPGSASFAEDLVASLFEDGDSFELRG